MKAPNRRTFLKISTGLAGTALLGKTIDTALAASCSQTPAQTAGPFYPGESRFDQNTDLTVIPGQNRRAEGQVVYVRGQVLDPNCQPVVGANVEIWQACASGKYNNPRDPNPAPIDPHFRYWAETYTNDRGVYLFKTILPGAYPADRDWTRPPHIHFKITKLRFRDLVTQMYFKGNSLNGADLILNDIPAHERDSVIVDFQPAPADLEVGSLIGTFNITLHPVR